MPWGKQRGLTDGGIGLNEPDMLPRDFEQETVHGNDGATVSFFESKEEEDSFLSDSGLEMGILEQLRQSPDYAEPAYSPSRHSPDRVQEGHFTRRFAPTRSGPTRTWQDRVKAERIFATRSPSNGGSWLEMIGHVKQTPKLDNTIRHELSFRRKRPVRIYPITARDETGRQAWYIVEVSKAKITLFERALQKGSFNLLDYGQILESAYGESIPAEVLKRYEDL